jgi:hypothetical protein
MKRLDHPLDAGMAVPLEPCGTAARDALTDIEKVIVRDAWNKLVPFDGMLSEMFVKRLIIEAPELSETFGQALDQARIEFLRLFDLVVRGLKPRTEHVLREAYRAAPGAADAQSASVEDCGWFFAAHGMTARHWVVAREVFLWVVRQIPYLEAYERENLGRGEDSAFWRFFTLSVIAPMKRALHAAHPSAEAAREMHAASDALSARDAEAGGFFYGALFERHPEILPHF